MKYACFILGLVALIGCEEFEHSPSAALVDESTEVSKSAITTMSTHDFVATPDNLWVEIRTKNDVPSRWLRHISFCKTGSDDCIDVPVFFERVSASDPRRFIGTAFSADNSLAALKRLSHANNRAYWDSMFFTNKGFRTHLNIQNFSATIMYDWDNTDQIRDCEDDVMRSCKKIQIARMDNVYLGGPGSKIFLLPRWGRYLYIRDQLFSHGITSFTFNDLVWSMIDDLGKSGTDLGPEVNNPKYGGNEEMASMCSEAVSWYYHNMKDSYAWYDEEFLFGAVHSDLAWVFINAGRLYCYKHDEESFVRTTGIEIDGTVHWHPAGYQYIPQAGDYLTRWDNGGNNGHAMMMVGWLEGNPWAEEDVAVVLSGPGPVVESLRRVGPEEVLRRNNYCVGRMPNCAYLEPNTGQRCCKVGEQAIWDPRGLFLRCR